MNVTPDNLFLGLRKQARYFAVTLGFACLCGAALAEDKLPFFSPYPQFDEEVWYLSHGWANGPHQSCEWRAEAVSAKDGGVQLRLADEGSDVRAISCAEIQSQDLFHYGRYEARMRTAAGSGLNTAFFTYIGPPLGVDEHDEIDFEFLGKDPHTVEVTFHRAGEQYDAIEVPLGFDASAEFHNYAFEWRPDGIKWFVDDKLVYETPPGTEVPLNPGKIFLSLWSGDESLNDWLGRFRYQGPVTAQIEWVRFTPFSDLERPDEHL